MFKWLFAPLYRLWQYAELLGWVLTYCRFSLLVVLLAGVIMMVTGQGREIAVRTGDDLWHLAAFSIAAFFWALQSWFWARLILSRIFLRTEMDEHAVDEARIIVSRHSRGLDRWQAWLVDWTPRLIGLLAYGLVLSASWMARDVAGNARMIEASSAGMVVFAIIVIGRRHLRDWLAGDRSGAAGDGGADLSRLAPVMYVLSVTTLGVLVWWSLAAPVEMGFALGSAAVVFVAFACIVPVGSVLVLLTYRKHFPIIVLLAAAVIPWSWKDNAHDIRKLDATQLPRPGFEDALTAWHRQAPIVTLANGQKVKPLVVVAAEGGGIRAAFWTARVLGSLESEIPDFHRSIFAISSVSGGSVGATFYHAGLARAEGGASTRTDLSARLLDALRHDFLAPVASRLLFVDVLHMFPPISFETDRAAALERALERGFAGEFEASDGAGLAGNFLHLWPGSRVVTGEPDPAWYPALLLNGTHQETGRRVITSDIRITDSLFPETFDFLENFDGSIAASTAAHNSARFPYVSPAGRWHPAPGHVAHILDGGYFENYGALTALETVQAVLQFIASTDDCQVGDGMSEDGTCRILPIILQIASDADYDGSYWSGAIEDHLKGQDFMSRGLNEFLGPVRGLLNVRGAHASRADRILSDWVRQCRAIPVLASQPVRSLPCGRARTSYQPVHLSLVPDYLPDASVNQVPLGWVLSENSERHLEDMFDLSGSDADEGGPRRKSNDTQGRCLRDFLKDPLEVRNETLSECLTVVASSF